MLSLLIGCLITISYAIPSLNLQINSASNGNNFYSVNVNNEQWLQSGQLEAYFDGQWYTANSTTAKNDKIFSLMNLVSKSTINNRYDDFGGAYTLYIFEWQAGITIFETNFKVYSDGKAISFVQNFPNGVPNTAFMGTDIPSGCGGSQFQPPPILSFPSFNVINMTNQYANHALGYLTWGDTFSNARYGKAPLPTNHLDGINGGPVVLFDNTSINAIVISTNDNFGVSTQLNNIGGASILATFMNDSSRNDSLFCISSECYGANTGYKNRIKEGLGAANNGEDYVSLTLWYSDQYEDNYVAINGPPDNTYTISFNNGYIYKNQNNDNSRLPVDLYYSAERKDHATVATQDIKNNLKAMGYKFISTQGYIDNSTNDRGQNNDWRLGISGQVLKIPQGFQHETVIVIGNGISDAFLGEWSYRLQSKYHTSKVDGDKDIVTSYLGYWTDDGAYYYGDSWKGATSPAQNLTCCSLDVFKDVKSKLDADKIPIRYQQMDDWWYKGLHPSEYSSKGFGGVKAVQHWEPPQTYYPGGLAALSSALQVPLLLYGPYFSPDNDWIGEFSFIPQGAGYVLPSPEDSYGFYSALMDFGINASTTGPNTGMIGYEVDFMSCLSGTPEFRMIIDAQQQWLDGMNKAAEERGITIQYCMATPYDLMQSLSLSQVTNGRASGDYAFGGNWNIGGGALLWSALGLKPSKDNLWTSFNEPYPPECHPAGNDHNSTDVHVIGAIMSCGPVGPSDRAGYTNATLIMRTCRADGRLLQPIRPITAIDDQFLESVYNGNGINVWSTEFGPYDERENVYILGHVVYAIDMSTKGYTLTYDSFSPGLNSNFDYIVRNWYNYVKCVNGTSAIKNGCIQLVKANSNMLYKLVQQPVIPPMVESFELIHVLEGVSMSSLVFLGELDKYVSVSQHRFDNLIIVGMSLSVNVRGQANEMVNLSVLKPDSTNSDFTVYTYQVTIGSGGNTQFNLNL